MPSTPRPPTRPFPGSTTSGMASGWINELGAMLVAAGLSPPAEYALISPLVSLLALNGLRVSDADG